MRENELSFCCEDSCKSCMSPNSKGEENKKVNNNNILYIIYIIYILFFLTEEISFEFFWRFWGFFLGIFSKWRMLHVFRFCICFLCCFSPSSNLGRFIPD